MRSLLRRYPMPTVFIVALCAVSSVYAYGLGPSGQRSMIAVTATNLVNLRTNPIGTLVASAFVSEAEPWVWIAFAIAGLFPLAHRFGNLRALALVFAGQVLGTLVSEGVLALRISLGEQPATLRFLDDVGPSYVIASGLIATILYGAEPIVRTARHGHRLFDLLPSRWWRLGALAGLSILAPDLLEGIGHLEVAAVGHVVAMLTAASLGLFLARAERARAARGQAGPALPAVAAQAEPEEA